VKQYIVWDEYNGDEFDSPALIDEYDAQQAAIAYAKRDIDGQLDGLYYATGGREMQAVEKDGQPIMVRCPDGSLHCFKVGVTEFHPVFSASEVPVEVREEKK